MKADLGIFDSTQKALELGLKKGEKKGYNGWNDPNLCDRKDLFNSLNRCLIEGDYQGVITYAAMLHYRDVHRIDS